MKKQKLSKSEKSELKVVLKETYLKAKANYDMLFKELCNKESRANGVSGAFNEEKARENLEIEKEIMQQTLLKIDNLKRM